MAIVSMKRVSLLAMAADRGRLLRAMQRCGCVQVTEAQGDAAAYAGRPSQALEEATDRQSRIRWAIGHLNRYDRTKSSLLTSLSMPTATAEEARAATEHMPALMGVVTAAEEAERTSGDLRGQEARIRAQIDQLLPWRALPVPVEMIGDTPSTVQYIGTVGNRALDDLAGAFADLPVTLEHIGDEREYAFVWLVAHRSAQADVQAALKAADFSPVSFAGDVGTVAQLLDALHAQQREIIDQRDALEESLSALAVHMPRLKLLHEVVAGEVAREQAAQRFATTRTTFLLEGWVPAHATDTLEQALRAVTEDIAISFRDPLDEEQPPSLLANNPTAAPFETIVTSYSYPDPRGFDPTAIMAPFFACLFGMMLSDAGYGLVMSIAIPLIIHFLKPKPGMRNLLWILFAGGLFTIVWGAMFDTWFGASVKPMLINTLEQPIEMMMLCIGMGALHLFCGLGVAAYMNIRRGKVLDAVFDQLLWVVLIVGLPLMLLPQTATLGKIMAIVGAVGILLTAGRAKPNILGKLMGGAGALYNISSWLSDLLSYMRLFGMGLATGVIGMVFNMLAGLLMDMGIVGWIIAIPVLIACHIFNFAINALGAYVHSCRLQYIEFFSKFYEDGGRPFTPLAQTPLYYAIHDTHADGAQS